MRELPHFEFENWAVIALGGIPNKTQVGDMGIDGRIFPVSALENRRKAKTDELQLEEKFCPIQVKQKDKTGRLLAHPPTSLVPSSSSDIDAFEAMMAREECAKGFFVSFDYSSDALTEISRYFKQTGRVIVPLTVGEILDEQFGHKLA